jgi:hypothetical protein
LRLPFQSIAIFAKQLPVTAVRVSERAKAFVAEHDDRLVFIES